VSRAFSSSGARALVLSTPEGVRFSLPLAGPVIRFLAWTVDLACILAASFLLDRVLRAVQVVQPDAASALSILGYFVLSTGYPMALEWLWRGRTVGKRLLGLRVVDEEGLRLQFSQVAVRNLLRAVDSLPVFYLVGGATCFASAKAQRLGDYAAGTVVARSLRMAPPDLESLGPAPYNSLKAFPHLAARLRRRVSADEAALALQCLLRRDRLEPEARLRLFKELADRFRSMVKFPDEAVGGIPDEHYVRNVVELVYGKE